MTDVGNCEGFRMPARDGWRGGLFGWGRRRKTSKGGNRGTGYVGDAACAMGIWLPRLMMALADETIRQIVRGRCDAWARKILRQTAKIGARF